ncbi:ARM repeat-containing protein [Piromyces finnis]|uniref:ARM repeat-containing protein n=1 Tax=Piromyces finnis TaxID=1754191 RepID=A0A1Y1V487_9FUNG|nr:ARM repeat-containing protein [Piromyces finnis]|eukprot:ORX46898.1 ARM repeat-containing protein [Piromyces finnis]
MLIKLHSDTNKQLNSSLNNRPTQILIQITATIRNLVTNEHARSIILKDHIIKSLFLLLKSYSLFNKYEELVLNISRIFSKLSLYTDFQILLENSTSSIVTLTKLLLAHYNNNPLVVRICFILGNLSCDKTSTIPDIIFDYIPDLVQLLELLVRKTINKKIKSNDNQIEDNNKQENYEINLKEKEEEDVLIKLIRLIANMALNSKVGPIIAEIPEIKCLVDLFKIKNIHDNEELILNIIGAIANISYYNESNNEILDQRIIIAKLLLPLMFYDNVEAVIEASRVFGNITQFQDVCDFAKISKASEMFVILLDHSNRDVVYNICGVLINLINYQYHCDVYLQNEGVEKHLEILELCINMSDFDLACLICKIFYNLCLTDNNWAQKISNSDDILIQLYNLLEVSQEYQYSIPFLNDTTIKDDDAFDKKVIDDNENNHETIDLFQSSHTTEDFLHYMDISTKLMNKLILYIEYAESQQNLLMDYSNPEPDYEVDTIQKMTENFDEATEEDEILYK